MLFYVGKIHMSIYVELFTRMGPLVMTLDLYLVKVVEFFKEGRRP